MRAGFGRENLTPPNPELGSGYYIRARIWNVPEDNPNGKTVAGWTLIPIEWTGSHTSLPILVVEIGMNLLP